MDWILIDKYMADTGVKYPASVATAKETGDDNDWTTAANVGANDGAYASITAATFDSPDTSYVMRATNLSMGVPAGATINGILVEIERHSANGAVADDDVCLTKDGSTRAGDDLSTGATFNPTTDTTVSFGGATNLWNTTWTAAQVNASTFGVIYKMTATGTDSDGFVDFIRVTVYYTAAVNDSYNASALGLTVTLQSPTLNYDYSYTVPVLNLISSLQSPVENYDYQLNVLSQALSLSQKTPVENYDYSFGVSSILLTCGLLTPDIIIPIHCTVNIGSTGNKVSYTVYLPTLKLQTSLKSPDINF